jgi:transglycosylase
MLLNNSWEKLRASLDYVSNEIASNRDLQPSKLVCDFMILGEDHRFYSHIGVDVVALFRAVWKTVFYRERQGGSTIAMQLVRTLTGKYERSIYRKISEIILAVRTTKYVGRASIPIMYAWVAYYGSNMNNYRQACAYLGLRPNSMTDMDASQLIARLKYPQPRQCSARRKSQILSRALHLQGLRKKITLRCLRQAHNGTISNCSANTWAN